MNSCFERERDIAIARYKKKQQISAVLITLRKYNLQRKKQTADEPLIFYAHSHFSVFLWAV